MRYKLKIQQFDNCFIFYFSAMPKKIVNPKIALLDFGLMKAKMKLGVQVLIEDPDKLAAVRER